MVLARIILGFLAIAPMTGYDLKRHFDETVNHFWSADKAQIYRTLASLVDDGLAAVETVPGRGAPDRQEHRITQAGRAALAEWLASPPERQARRNPLLARVFFGDALGPDDLRARLAAHREAVTATLETFEGVLDEFAREDAHDPGTRLRLATVENGLAHARAELAWVDGLLADLATGPTSPGTTSSGTTPPGTTFPGTTSPGEPPVRVAPPTETDPA
ncbi:MAG: PadR family transcriptional regulator [Pseudoclavibacter sp.]